MMAEQGTYISEYSRKSLGIIQMIHSLKKKEYMVLPSILAYTINEINHNKKKIFEKTLKLLFPKSNNKIDAFIKTEKL